MNAYYLIACASLSFATMTSMAQVAYAGPDTLICDGSYTMQGSPVPVGGSGTWSLIVGCATIVDPSLPGTLVTGLCPYPNELVWEVFDGVSTTSDTVTIGVVDLPTIANAGPDQTINGPPFSAQLMGNSPVFPSYCSWTVISGAGDIMDPSNPNTFVSNLSIGANIFSWTCFTGPCANSDVVTINAFVWTGIRSSVADLPSLFVLDPQADQLRLNTPGKVEAVVLTDVQGRAMELQPGGSMHSWSTAHYAAGFYIVRAMVDDQLVSLRFVLDH